jgi:hypothetical protein
VVQVPIATRFPLEETNEAMEQAREGAVGRIVVQVSN